MDKLMKKQIASLIVLAAFSAQAADPSPVVLPAHAKLPQFNGSIPCGSIEIPKNKRGHWDEAYDRCADELLALPIAFKARQFPGCPNYANMSPEEQKYALKSVLNHWAAIESNYDARYQDNETMGLMGHRFAHKIEGCGYQAKGDKGNLLNPFYSLRCAVALMVESSKNGKDVWQAAAFSRSSTGYKNFQKRLKADLPTNCTI
jgi:hypothetical protein